MNPNSSTAEPSKNTTTATVISYAGGPYIYPSITTYNSTIYEGDNDFISGYVKNLGNETANDINVSWKVPDGWSIVSGSLNNSIPSLVEDDLEYFNITISPDSSNVDNTITLKSSRSNSSGYIINHTDSVSITVLSQTTQDDDTTTSTSSGGGGGGGSSGGRGGGGAVSLTTEEKDKLFNTEESFKLVRGSDNSFVISMENPFEDPMQDVSISVSGLLSKYLSIQPTYLSVLESNNSVNFTVSITAPSYFEEGDHVLDFVINGSLTHVEEVENVTVTQVSSVVDKREVTLKILEMKKESAKTLLNKSKSALRKMKNLGYSVSDIEEKVSRAEFFFEDYKFSKVEELADKVGSVFDLAVSTDKKLSKLNKSIKKSNSRYIDTVETTRAFNIALAAFNRGDFKLASKRADEAELIYATEVKGEIPFKWYFEKYKSYILSGIVGFILISLILSYFLKKRYYAYKISECEKEEEVLLGLIKEIQKETFSDNKHSLEEYHSSLQQYENKLATVLTDHMKYQTKQAHMLSFKSRKESLKEEKERLTEMIEDLQEKYLGEGIIETRIYESRMNKLSDRVAEIDEQIALINAKKALKKAKFKKHKGGEKSD